MKARLLTLNYQLSKFIFGLPIQQMAIKYKSSVSFGTPIIFRFVPKLAFLMPSLRAKKKLFEKMNRFQVENA